MKQSSLETSWGEFYEGEIKPFVDMMVAKFNQAKAASGYVARRGINTGILDLTRLANYRTSDNIFKTEFLKKKCKNHGVWALLDFSGSMYMDDIIQNVGIQAVKLAFFARRTGVKFELCGFTSSHFYSYSGTYGAPGTEPHSIQEKAKKDGFVDLQLNSSSVRLFRFLDSDTRTEADFILMCKNFLTLCANRGFGGDFTMNGTPLIEAVDLCGQYIKQFKEKNRIENLNVLILTDGMAEEATMTDIRNAGMENVNGFVPSETGHTKVVFKLRSQMLEYTFDKREGEKTIKPERMLSFVYYMMRRYLNCKLSWIFLVPDLTLETAVAQATELVNNTELDPPDLANVLARAKQQYEENGLLILQEVMGCNRVYVAPSTLELPEDEVREEGEEKTAKDQARDATREMIRDARNTRLNQLLAIELAEAIAKEEAVAKVSETC